LGVFLGYLRQPNTKKIKVFFFFNNSEEILDFLNKETEYFNGLKTNGFDAGLQESYGFKFLEAIQSLGF